MSWRTASLEDICVFIRNGKSIQQSKDEDGLPITRIETIANQSIDEHRVGYAGVTEDEVGDHLLQTGDILFSHINSLDHLGKTAIYEGRPRKLVHGMNLLNLRPDQSVAIPGYLLHVLRAPHTRAKFQRIANKSVNQASISVGNLKKVTVPLPPLTEQRRIAAILDKADALRAKRREAIAKLDQLLQSVFLDMFGDPVTNPKSWSDDECLGDVADICSGITKGRRTVEKVREVPYLAVANVQDRHLRLNGVKAIEATEGEIDRYRLKVDDLLLTEGGDPDKLGRGALWDGSIPDCIHQNHVFRVRVTSSEISPVYLNWLVGSSRGKKYFLGVAKQTTGIASINMTQLKRFPLLIPPIKLQRRFADAVSRIDEHRKHLDQASQVSERLMQSLQRNAFAGTL